MQAVVDKVLLIPRYTSFAGATTFLTPPMNVRDYSHANVTFVEAGALGAIGPGVTVTVQESPDLEIWNDIGSSINNGDTNEQAFQFEWIRLKLVVTGTDPCFTCWCVGDFVRRHA
jgi:hypothetical protein